MNWLRPTGHSWAIFYIASAALLLNELSAVESSMIRRLFVSSIAFALVIASMATESQAVLLLYEPFDYPANNFLSATAVGTPNSTTSPIGNLAPNFNNWYGTGQFATYQTANDGQITATDLTVPGLAKPSSTTRSLTLGNDGQTFRLSLNSSTAGSPNLTTPNLTDIADPLAGTDQTLQGTDTGHSGYYSIALKVGNITGLNSAGGVLMGFNNVIGGQLTNPTTVAAALTIRPKAGGSAGEFQLGVVKQGSGAFADATWDTINTYTVATTIFVVGKYQTVGPLQNSVGASDDIASLWINPASSTFGGYDPEGAITSTFGTDVVTDANGNNHTLQSFVLRQTNIANNQIPLNITYDELRVGTNWADVTPGVAGDYNGNGVVDGADYITWRKGIPLKNEVDTRPTINGADYTEWRARFGNPNAPGSGGGAGLDGGSVPEPATAVIGLLSVALLSVRRRTR